MKRLRLLKVIVQPVFVLDDGDSLTEQQGRGVEVSAGNWREFGRSAFDAAEMAALQAQFVGQPSETDDSVDIDAR